jgi:hypothetical protein
MRNQKCIIEQMALKRRESEGAFSSNKEHKWDDAFQDITPDSLTEAE